MLRLELTKGGGGHGNHGFSPETGCGTPTNGWNGEDPAQAADLRRRRKAEQIELVLHRASVLALPDRTLLEWILRDGRTAIQVAHVTKESVRAVRRRVRRLMRRLLSPEFLFVVRERQQWPATRRRVADACIVEGRSMHQTSRDLNMSFHTVRRQIECIAGAFEIRHPDKPWSMPVGFRRDGAVARSRARGAEGGAS